jgi:hypothetical protein
MKAFRPKTRNTTPCHGVIGGVREIPPDTKTRRKRKTRLTKLETMFNATAPVAVRMNTCYDNANVTTPGLLRVLIVCFITMIVLMIFS